MPLHTDWANIPQLSDIEPEHKYKWMQSQQLHTNIGSMEQISLINRSLTNFEQLLVQEQKLTHNLSNVY